MCELEPRFVLLPIVAYTSAPMPHTYVSGQKWIAKNVAHLLVVSNESRCGDHIGHRSDESAVHFSPNGADNAKKHCVILFTLSE